MGDFKVCEICGSLKWTRIYDGRIRDGVFGKFKDRAAIARCGGCAADRLNEASCPSPNIYDSAAYRQKVGQGLASGNYFAEHDSLQSFTQGAVWPLSLRGKTIADVGCAGGSLLDHYSGVAARLIAVEPSDIYWEALNSKGYRVYPYAIAASQAGERADYAFSIQVIEHVESPLAFLREIRALLKPDGRLLISTPNRNDILLKLIRDEYEPFFYRVVHRWYFDEESLRNCATRAGFVVTSTKYVHRYPLSNALLWLRDKAPKGWTRLEGITELADGLWEQFLVATAQAECLYMELAPTS